MMGRLLYERFGRISGCANSNIVFCTLDAIFLQNASLTSLMAEITVLPICMSHAPLTPLHQYGILAAGVCGNIDAR
jgi:hypothetical protein